MKLYRKLLALTLSLGFIFVIGYLSGLLIDTQTDWWVSLSGNIAMLPSAQVFEWAWVAVYLFIVILMTPAVAEKKLRRALPLWIIVGALNVVWVLTFFRLRLPLTGLSVLLVELALLSVITERYIRNTRFLWSAMIPVLGWYIFSILLNLEAII